MPAKPKTTDDYLASLNADQRATLGKLRRTIRKIVPKAGECISYGLPAFRLDGRPLVAFGAAANHCSFYPMSSAAVAAHQDDLADYDTSKGTIRFAIGQSLPAALLRKIVQSRIAEIAARHKPASRPKSRKSAAKPQTKAEGNASRLIDQRIRDLGDWRGETLAEVRRLIREADPDIVEECKWFKPSNPLGVPVWSHDGIICTGETYKDKVKLTFARGASLDDPAGLFNSSRDGGTRRAIDFHEGERLNAAAFQALVKAAVDRNRPAAKKSKPVKLLSGGNPQIAKGDGNAPVQAYIAAMPDWKRDLGQRLDALIERTVPAVRKAVKWNSPFYGIEGQGWFLSFHVFTRYVKVSFFRGTSLHPVPPGGTPKSQEVRWIDIHEGDKLDEEQMAIWVKQAAALPGWLA